MKKLNVPYRSQSDPDAGFSLTDCGAACVAMLLSGFGNVVKIDDVFKATNRAQDVFLARSDLIRASAFFNLSLKKFENGSQDFLKKSIDDSKPFIALINYGAWSKRGSGVPTQSKFTGPHFVVVTGYDDNDVFIHDPLWWGVHRSGGSDKRMSYAQLAAAWGTASSFPGNPNFAGLIPNQAIPGSVQPVVPPAVKEEEINRILAWAFIAGFTVDASTLAQREVADVFLKFMGNWGNHVVSHVVQPGEDLGLLALRYYIDPLKWKVIALFNGLPPIGGLKEGDTLKIPEPTNQ